MNGQTKFAVTFVSDLFESNEMPYCKQINRKFKNNFNLCGIFYVGILLFIYLIIISIAGSFFINAENYEYSYLSESERKIYSFSAIVSNWAGILVFLIIAVILLGAIKNEKTKKIKTDDSKCFLPCA
ncbi:hypothetical protein FACS189459_5350 [Bacilli bacterium]|nr:hypothetical protein FACS189459_5350 [Bacilli bacterium]GHU51771.1 hypothetical protein FACS189496_0750 [Bacilli bacterium]